jgi:hypothetical protein
VNHPDIRVRIKKALQDDIITPCPKCAASDLQDLENKKKNEKQKRAIERAKAKKEYGEDGTFVSVMIFRHSIRLHWLAQHHQCNNHNCNNLAL